MKQPWLFLLKGKLLLLCALFLTVVSCVRHAQKPNNVLSKSQMVQVLTDVHLAEGAKTGRKVMGDTLRVETYYQKVFDKHKVSLNQFEESYKYYTSQPKEMNDIYEEVIEALNRIEVRVPKWTDQKTKTVPDSIKAKKIEAFKNEIIKNTFPPAKEEIQKTKLGKQDSV